MIHEFNYPYPYDKDVITNWKSDAIGVYYLGVKTNDNRLIIYYIGRAVGDGGIRNRLLQHLQENKWFDVKHFGYHVCDTAKEAIDFEATEIATYKPKYNTQGV